MPDKQYVTNFRLGKSSQNLVWVKDAEAKEMVDQVNVNVQNVQNNLNAAKQKFNRSIEQVNDEIDALKLPRNLASKKAVLVGDSYLRGVGGVDGHGWGYFLQSLSGMKCTEVASSKCGFTRQGTTAPYENMTFVQMLNKAAQGMTLDTRKTYDYVVVAGGYNDHLTDNYTNVRLATEEFVTTAMEMFPNAIVAVIPLYADARFTDTIYNTYYGIHLGAKNKGAITLFNSIFWLYGSTSWVAGDDIHPNNTGYQVQGAQIMSLLNGGDGSYSSLYSGGLKMGAHSTKDSTSPLHVTTKDGFTTLMGGVDVTGSIDADTVLFTIPAHAAPSQAIYPIAFFFKGTSNRQAIPMRIYPNGNCTVAPRLTQPDMDDISDCSFYFCSTWMMN